MSTRTPFRIGRRSVIIGAAALGFSIGGYTLASAAQSAFFDDNPSASDLSELAAADVTTGETGSTVADDSTSNTIDDSTSTSIDDNGDDNGTSTTIDDNGGDDNGTSTTIDDSSSTTAGSSNPLPAPFTETYNVAGGSITVTWDGAKFHLDAVNAADGHTPEVETRNDRIKVRFRGDNDSRIEVRISDDDNSLRVELD